MDWVRLVEPSQWRIKRAWLKFGSIAEGSPDRGVVGRPPEDSGVIKLGGEADDKGVVRMGGELDDRGLTKLVGGDPVRFLN